jgi:hypothetical protein
MAQKNLNVHYDPLMPTGGRNNDKSSACMHCSAEGKHHFSSCVTNQNNRPNSSVSNNNNNTERNNDSSKLTNPPQSRAASPYSMENKHFPLNKVVFNQVYQYNNALTPTFIMSHKPLSAGKKKIIKMQDCTTWLSMASHQKNGFSPVLSGNESAMTSAGQNGNHHRAGMNGAARQSSSVYLADTKVFEAVQERNLLKTNRIEFLLNRKSSRVSTLVIILVQLLFSNYYFQETRENQTKNWRNPNKKTIN